MNDSPDCLKEPAIKILLSFCTNPTKVVYIPGKSREHSLIKEQLIVERGIPCLLRLSRFSNKENEETEKVLSQEITLKILGNSNISTQQKPEKQPYSSQLQPRAHKDIKSNLENLSMEKKEEIQTAKKNLRNKRKKPNKKSKKKRSN